MRDFYLEQIVKRRNTKRMAFGKFALAVGTVASFLLVTISPLFLLLTVVLAIATYKILKITDVEYEYIYFNGNFDVDKIMSKQKRKRVLTTNFHEIEVIAPTGSLEIQQYRKNKSFDMSSQKKGAKTYQMVINHKGIRVRIIFEPNEELLNEMKLSAPRKVYI